MAYKIKVVFGDDTISICKYKVREVLDKMKKSPLNGKRKRVPALPWLIDLGMESKKGPHGSPIKRIDITEGC